MASRRAPGAPPSGVLSEPAAAAVVSGFAVFVLGNTEVFNGSQVRFIYKKLSLDGGGSFGPWEPLMAQWDSATNNPEAWSSGGYDYTVAAPTTYSGHGVLNYCYGTVP